ncbi:response regulator transcription factor [candidate division WWE3 bacterium]|nr:response regulator transcription factor [candidate division WWE3 bacterium]
MAKKILVVEDNLEIAEVYEIVLADEGYEVTIRLTGETGLNEALASQYDLILLDVMLPGMNGISILKELRKNPQTAQTPVYMLTALGQDTIKKQAHDAGAIEVLVKSTFTPDQIVEKVNAVLGSAQ